MKSELSKLEDYFLLSTRGEIYENVISLVEKELIEKALERTYGNQVMAARILGLNRNTLHSKILKLSVDIQRFKK